MDDYTVFTEEALRSQDGKKVPLTDRPGGEVIGEATMHYDEKTGELRAKMLVTDPVAAEYLAGSMDAVIFKRDNL
jgi:hypothetical protein